MSSAGLASSKRKRETEDVNESPDSDEPVKQSPRCWFDDGNVILQAECVQVRVHRSVLAYHSDIMKDCFGCPQPEDGETLEGCPVIHLPDSAEDIENMCILLYGAKHINHDTIEPSYLMTMIRIGRKYEIHTFTEMALTYLRKLFPRDQNLWVASRPKVRQIVTDSRDFLFDIVNLAYENQIPSILPAAFLGLYTHHSLNEILSGIELPGQRRAVLVPKVMQTCVLSRAACSNLFYDSLRTCLGRLHKKSGEEMYLIPHHLCDDKWGCTRALVDFFSCSSGSPGTECEAVHFPVVLQDLRSPFQFCPTCITSLEIAFTGCLKGWWDCLPDIVLDLPAWEEMKDFDDEV